MARLTGAALLGLALVLPLAPAAEAQVRWESSERTFYLHIAQYCDAASVIRWMDEFDWGNDLDGCGGNVLDPTTTTWTEAYPTFVPFHANTTTATAAEFHIFVLSRALDQTTVSAKIDTGYSTCEGSQGPETILASQVGGFTEFVFSCTFQMGGGDPDPMVKPRLDLSVDSTYTYGIGTEDDHASHIIFSGLDPAPPEEEVEFFEAGQRPRAKIQLEEEPGTAQNATTESKGGDSPATGLLGATLGVLVAVAALRANRRRE